MVEIPLAEVEAMPRRQQEALNQLVGIGPLKLYAERRDDKPDSIFVKSREEFDRFVTYAANLDLPGPAV